MKRIIQIFAVSFFIFSCSTDKQGNMLVSGTIKGLKKGTLVLQKVNDSTLITVDSISLLEKNSFELTDNVSSPELYFLTFDANNTQKTISFFGEEGNITINSDVDLFNINAEITGSENQKVYEEFLKVQKQFSNQNLEFIKKEFDYKKDKKTDSLELLKEDYSKFIRRKYLYTTNFALNNSNLEVAPFLALTELSNANIKLLDTINNSLSTKVKNSLYGKKLEEFIKQIKETE